MHEFATRGTALYTAPADWVSRLVMCGLPTIIFTPGHFGFSAATALWLGFMDGFARLWGSCSSRALVAEPEGLTISCLFSCRIVLWANVSAIRTWHHLNRLEYVAVHYRGADGRLQIASCLDQCDADELREFVSACAGYASSAAPRRNITFAGLRDQGVYLPLFRRFTQDIATATVVGWALGTMSTAIALGLLAASLSLLVALIRHPFRTTTFVEKEGLWCSGSRGLEARPLQLIPRSLQLWVRGLAEAAYRNSSSRGF